MAMRDPPSEKITGRKVDHRHIHHKIDWGYAAIAIAVILVVAFIWLQLRDRSAVEGDGEEGENVVG